MAGRLAGRGEDHRLHSDDPERAGHDQRRMMNPRTDDIPDDAVVLTRIEVVEYMNGDGERKTVCDWSVPGGGRIGLKDILGLLEIAKAEAIEQAE